MEHTPNENKTLEITEYGKIETVPITTTMEKSYLDYAMSVIVSRALPDVRDGLKPVQRRILYAMRTLGLNPGSPFKKSARIVGETIGKYHPHGDAAVYDAMVRLAQNFSLRYPLVDGQGNFGSIDGDPPAHMRYTEARLQKIAVEMLDELDQNTIDFRDNFDGTETEPSVLPAKLPNLLANGVDGIAVGMATKIPPHNLNELVDALIMLLEKSAVIEYADQEQLMAQDVELFTRMENFYTHYNQDAPYFIKPKITFFYLESGEITTEDLMQFIPGPDFPTAGEIYDKTAILQAYSTGRGPIIMRAKSEIVETNNGRMQIEVTELPYQQNKALLIAHIANLVKDGKIEDIADLRDESDRTGLKIVIEIKRGANPQRLLNQLYKFTPMQQTYNVNMVALENGEPRVMTLKGILAAYLKHRQEVVIRRNTHKLINALHRGHILEGLKIALDNLDEVIDTIRKSPDADQARLNLMSKFSLSEIQAVAILEMQLRRLAALEREKILNELKEVLDMINNLKKILGSPDEVLGILKAELNQLKDTYGDKRRTKVYKGKPGEISDEELIKEEDSIIVLSRGGYIKRVSPLSFKTQGRGGKGVSGGNLKEEDIIYSIIQANTHDQVMFFTTRGRVFLKRVWDIPEASRTARGTPAVNLIGIDQDETITSVLIQKGATNEQ
ncbi:DNA gyrase subunit A [candidate division WWE3 bacterium]|nr:DNA gyrase subunit A [candidate division WWE3 bacterium]